MAKEVHNTRRDRMETPCETIVFDMVDDIDTCYKAMRQLATALYS